MSFCHYSFLFIYIIAFLALQTMSGRMLFDRPIKTGWANHVSANPNVDVVTSQEFPEDSTNRAQTAYMVLAQLTVHGATTTSAPARTVMASIPTEAPSTGTSRVPTVAEARASLAAQGASRTIVVPLIQPPVVAVAPVVDPTRIGNAEAPTRNVLVHNMYNKDEETEQGWEIDIRDEFQEECSKYGKILAVKVMHTEPGGKIYASFDSIAGAQNCASNLAGRWFDKRQLRVEFISDSALPISNL
jgi:RNA-binding protein 23/39